MFFTLCKYELIVYTYENYESFVLHGLVVYMCSFLWPGYATNRHIANKNSARNPKRICSITLNVYYLVLSSL